jgi:sugar lactone lactonase YvrE
MAGTTMPTQLRSRARRFYAGIMVDQIEIQCVADARCVLGEGPVWVEREAALYWVDIKGRKILRLDAQQQLTEWTTPMRIGSIAPLAETGFIAGTDEGIAIIHPDADLYEIILRPEDDRPGNRLNDGKVDRQGRFWAGSMDDSQRRASGALYRVDANRTINRVDDDYRIANGPAFSPDGRTMYHSDTGRNVTYIFDLAADGEATNRRVWLRHDPTGGHPDGMTVDREGAVWIAFWGGWCVRRFSPDGECLQTVRLPVEQPSSCAFGGPHLDRLYVTSARESLTHAQLEMQPSAGGLFMLEAGVQGIAERPFAG